MAEKAKKQSAGKFYDICRRIMYVVTIPFFILILLIVVIAFGAKSNNGVPSLFGKQALKIEKTTMLPEFKVGDVVLIEKVSATELNIGDKIAYYEFLGKDQAEKTYSEVDFNAIVAVQKLQNPLDEHYGKLFFQLQGTYADFPEDGWIMEDYVVGILASQNGFMESFLVFCASMGGVVMLAIIPGMIEVFLIAVYIIGIKKAAKKTEEEEDEAKEIIAQVQQPSKAEDKKQSTQRLDKQTILERIKTEAKVSPAKVEQKFVSKKPAETKAPEASKVAPVPAPAETKAPETPKVAPAPAPAVPKAPEAPKVAPVPAPAVPKAPEAPKAAPVPAPAVPKAPEAPKVTPPKAPPAPPKAPPAPPKAPPVPPKAPPVPPKK